MARKPATTPRGSAAHHPQGDGLILALDAGSPLVSAALGRGGTVLAERSAPQERSSSQVLALVAEVLAEAGARPPDLAGVVALAGPGSFTGLRVGLATALGLHQALGVPAQAVPTLLALAAASEAPAGTRVIAAVDALRGEWSAQAFRAGPVPLPLGEMLLAAAGGLLRMLAAGAGEAKPARRQTPDDEMAESLIIAFGAAALRGLDLESDGPPARLVEAPPLAVAALRLAAANPIGSWRAASLAAPIYSRPPATSVPRPRIAVVPGPGRR